jgi:hypothetical protein
MAIDLRKCDKACEGCIRRYIGKHRLTRGDKFEVKCDGIPTEFIPQHILAQVKGDPEISLAMLDPVIWAARFLDWHCLDPEGKIWKRKTMEGSLKDLPPYVEEQALAGKSIFHRPYQAEMLRCSSKRKVFRIGRQSGKTECLCVAILFAIYTHQDFVVEVIAPYQSQIDLIFTRLMQLVRSSPTYQNSVKRHVKAPNYTLELHNGSLVKGFTAASRSGGDAGASRGQHANMLVFDEADYLNQADIDAALAVIINYPDATVWMSSTPTGKRQSFYNTCGDKMFREFHYPSTVNPNWTPDLEQFFRSRLSSIGYKQEILADFGEQEEGVYQVKFVENAQADFVYSTQKWNPGWVYNIGVDWNDVKIGSTFYVVGWNPGDTQFYLVDRQCVQKEGWNQIAACQMVQNLNRVWRPRWIYVDHGFGHMQVEVLHSMGRDATRDPTRGPKHIDARLARIVKPYEFGGSIEVRDPFTKQMVKKPAKPFLVESSVRLFESSAIRYPESDRELTKALMGYKIKRVNQSGVPVYEQGDAEAGDHFLDAMNLALVAFVLEESEFGKPKYDPYIAHSAHRLGDIMESKEAEEKSKQEGRTAVFADVGPGGSSSRSILSRPSSSGLPASHTSDRIEQTRIWSWPGFSADLPPPTRPRPRTPNRPGRPKRNNF